MVVKRTVIDALDISISRFLYYDRKDDNVLSPDQLVEAVRDGTISIDEMVAFFTREVTDYFAAKLS